jgi:hypothetical protein
LFSQELLLKHAPLLIVSTSARLAWMRMLCAFSFLSIVSNLKKYFCFSNSKRTNKRNFCFLSFVSPPKKNLRNYQQLFVRPKRAMKKVRILSSFFFELEIFVPQRNGFVVCRKL